MNMGYRVTVSPSHHDDLYECYPWWIKFIQTEVNPIIDTLGHRPVDIFSRYGIIKDYFDEELNEVEFKDEKTYTLFILKWS